MLTSTRALMGTTTVLLAIATTGCGSTPAPTTPAPTVLTDAVYGVTDLSPAVGTTLAAGRQVTFTGTVGYSLNTAGTGALFMVLQDQSNQRLQPPGTQPTTAVIAGSGQATLSQTITLPSTGITSVRLFFSLLPSGATSTNSNVAITFAVK
jgi:hypothetical protein